MRLVPYQLKSLASHSFHKLQPRFYGPFQILSKVGVVAYKLKLPATSKLHPVFHVSCLKKHLGVPCILQDVPVAILGRRMVKKDNAAPTKVLVQWQNHSREDATWELYQDLKLKFPEIVNL